MEIRRTRLSSKDGGIERNGVSQGDAREIKEKREKHERKKSRT